MFNSLFRRLQGSVDDIVKNIALQALIVLPFALAVVFGLAALVTRLSTLYGPVTAYGVLAGLFFFAGLIIITFVRTDRTDPAARTSSEESAAAPQTEPDSDDLLSLDTLIAAVAAVGPTIAPTLGRAAARNWALVVLAAAVVYLMHSDSEESGPPVAAE